MKHIKKANTNKLNHKNIILFIIAFIFVLILQEQTVYSRTLTVSKNGGGDYKKIQSAVKKAKSGDTIIIYPGIYKEAVKIKGKTINLIGTDRDSCIVSYPTNNYYYVPLYIQAGVVNNMTFFGYGGIEGYTIHIDNAYQYGRDLTFNNCKIISEGAQDCLGIGTYGYNTIAFNDCYFETNTEFMFYHNSVSQIYNGPSLIAFNYCNVINTGISHIRSIDYNVNNPVTITTEGTSVNGIYQ